MSRPRKECDSAGWWCWLRRSLVRTDPSQISRTSTARRVENETPEHRTHGKGVFFPFLSDVDRRAQQQQQHQETNSKAVVSRIRRTSRFKEPTKAKDSDKKIIGRDGQRRRRTPGRKGVGVTTEKDLRLKLPLVWAFLREEEGWRFANDSSWDVCGSEVDGNSIPSAGPISQGQLPAYLMDHPELLEKFERWSEAKAIDGGSGSCIHSDGNSSSDSGVSSVSLLQGRALSPPSRPGQQLWPQEPRDKAAAEEEAEEETAVEAAVLSSSTSRDCRGGDGAVAIAAALAAQQLQLQRQQQQILEQQQLILQLQQQQQRKQPDATTAAAAAAAAITRGASAFLLPRAGRSPRCSRGGTEQQRPVQPENNGIATGAVPACSTAPPAGSFSCDACAGGVVLGHCGDGTAALTTPPALRTRSRYSSAKKNLASSRSREEGTAAGQTAQEVNAAAGVRLSGVMPSPPPPPPLAPRPERQGDVGGVFDAGIVSGGVRGCFEDGGWAQRPHGRRSGQRQKRGKGRKASATERGGEVEARGRGRASGRSGAGGSNRRLSAEKRGVSAEAEGVSDEGREAGRAAASVAVFSRHLARRRTPTKRYITADEDDEAARHDQPALKKPRRVKVEHPDNGGSNAASGGTPSRRAPTNQERASKSPRGAGKGRAGYVYCDRDDDDDPLAPYARIEAETVDDEGLDELLHSGRRDGYLDLRRYRKPGWPRPLRITRLEASHGKRFEEHVLQLLKEKKRVEATVLLRRLAHYDRNPPHLAASNSGRNTRACVPAWYQTLALGPQEEGGDGIEEIFDLTAEEIEVVECYDNLPLECVMMTVVKQEPGLRLKQEEEEGGQEDRVDGAGVAGATGWKGAHADAAAGVTDGITAKVKKETT